MHAPASLPPAAPRRRRSPGGLALLILTLLVLYFLSPPPLLLLAARCPSLQEGPGEKILGVVYAPLLWCSDRSPALQSFYQWYVLRVWRVPPPDFTFDTSDIVESLSVTHSTNAPPQ